MLIGVAAETDPAETRVAATPETVKKFIGLGAEVAVARGAGEKPDVPDADYRGRRRAARRRRGGARRATSSSRCAVRPQDIAQLKSGALVIATMDPYGHASRDRGAGEGRRRRPSRWS